MPPFRLAVSHLDDVVVATLAARLRGAQVTRCPELAPLPPCDAVVLGPAGVSAPAVVRLFAQHVHVLAVADPCPSWSVVEALSETARRAGVRFALVNPNRYLPSYQLIARHRDALGEPGLVRLHRWGPTGSLIGDLDTLLSLAGRPNQLFAIGAAQRRYLQVHLGFPSGAMALLVHARGLPDYHSLSVIAARGAAYADDHPNLQLLYRDGPPAALRVGEEGGAYAALTQAFLEELRDNREPVPAMHAWREVFATAEAVEQSLASGRAVALEGR